MNFNFVKFDKPFHYFYSDNFLAKSDYEELRKSFPPLDLFKSVNKDSIKNEEYKSKDGKFVLNTRGEEFNLIIEDLPYWKKFIEKIYSDHFLNKMRRVFLSELKEVAPDIAEKNWTIDKSVKDDNSIVLNINCQFSRMTNKSFIEPHKDSETKIISLLFYLPSDDYLSYVSSEKINYGGTNFHKVLFPESEIDERDIYYNFSSNIVTEGGTEYLPNRLAGFIRSNKSFHSVGPIVCPNSCTRDAFLINISRTVKPKYKKNPFYQIYKFTGRLKMSIFKNK